MDFCKYLCLIYLGLEFAMWRRETAPLSMLFDLGDTSVFMNTQRIQQRY